MATALSATGPLLGAVVAEAARRFGDRAVLVATAGWALSYADLHRQSDEAAAGLRGLGVGPGAVVSLLLPSVAEYVVASAAISKLGATVAGVNPRLAPPERTSLVELADPVAVLATASLAEGVSPERRVKLIEPSDAPDRVLAELRSRDMPVGPPPPADPERIAALVFTSGTTGTPRAAIFTERHLAAITAADWGDRWGGGGPMLAATQFAHVGFTTKLAWYLRSGSTQLLIDRWRAPEVLGVIERHRVASLGGVAPQFAILLAEPGFDRYDLDCVTTIIAGGAASPPALVTEARRRFGAAYSIRYSSTESGGVGTATAFDAPDSEALETVGRPRPGVELEIRDDDGRPVAAGEIGEVALRSPAVFGGYWRDPEATAATLREGWLHTADLGRIDEAGCLRLVGRAKEMYIRGGYNVYPAEVEAALASHPAVQEVAVVARRHPSLGETGVAVVVTRSGTPPPSLDELRTHAGASVARYKLPEAVRVVDELPRTPMQKIDRRRIEADVAGDADPVDQVP